MDTRPIENNFDLRSEKVRNILGQVPPTLLRYGIATLGIGLALLFIVGYTIPYKKVFTGTATIPRYLRQDTSIITLRLKFKEHHPHLQKNIQLPIVLYANGYSVQGILLKLSEQQDSLNPQYASCIFSIDSLRPIQSQEIDFVLVQESGNMLSKIFDNLFYLDTN